MRRAAAHICLAVLAALALPGCLAVGQQSQDTPRPVHRFDVDFDQRIIVESSVLVFHFADSADRSATHGRVHLSGSLGGGQEVDRT